jgi:putative ABC transport system permease protein
MKLHKCFKHALNMVLHSKIRSWLTILGIVIGVAAVIAIMSISNAMQAEINSRLNSLGGDIVTVTPGFSRGGGMFGGGGGPDGEGSSSTATTKTVTLTRTDLQVLKGMPEISMIDTRVQGTANVSYMGKIGKVSITGVDPSVWPKIATTTMSEGRNLDSADSNVVIIGGRLASSYFGTPVGINKMITIGGNSFRVVGIIDDESNSVYMPIQAAYTVIKDQTINTYTSLVVKVKDEDALNATMATMESKLMMSRHVTSKTKDFSITSSKLMQATISSTMSSMTSFLMAIAAVSLIVGAVGVANTMFTSVLEKTKEIGIMKAIGARNKDILLIFVFNAILIGLIGGILGVVLGIGLSAALPLLTGTSMISRAGSLVTMNSVIISLSVSTLVGLFAGIIPAYQGSKLKPVDALRYE